jgi:uncharacterized protein with PIN domain
MGSPDHPAHLTLTFHGDTLELLRAAPGKAELSSLSAQAKRMPLWYKAELSSSPAPTKLMPLWYKAELSSSPAPTKLMPLWYKNNTVIYPLSRRASIKDILEGLGLPHTEVGRITHEGRELTFAIVPEGGEHFAVHPWSPAISPTQPTLLRPQPLAACTFLVDNTVGKLARLLRMSGLDARTVPPEIGVSTAVGLGRILLTRNRDLLRFRELVYGRLVRGDKPEQQLREIVKLYRLYDQLRPFSRCMACNGLLADIDKKTILDRLLPLTKKYYTRFSHCPDCGNIYWRGGHHRRMADRLATLLGEIS